MKADQENPPITPFLRGFTLVETLVLIAAGFGLFFFPDFTGSIWPWQLAPFNTRFLGAVYLGAMVPVGLMFLSGRWSPTRPVLKAIFTFTFVVLIVSLLIINKFDFKEPEAWGWFFLYISLPLSAAYHLWLYRSMPTSHLNSVHRNWHFVLRTTSILLSFYGLGLFFVPCVFGNTFPWKFDVFHSQLYSATFITGGVMVYSISSKATTAEFIAVGLTEATFSIFSIIGLFIVDVSVNKINWTAPNTTTWLFLLTVLSGFGIAMVIAGIRRVPNRVDV